MTKYLFIAAILGFAGYYYNNHSPTAQSSASSPSSNEPGYSRLKSQNQLNTGVHIMTAKWCGYCTKLRGVLVKNNIPFTEYNVENDAQVDIFYQTHGLDGGVPVTVVGGDLVYGYNASKLTRAFKQNGITIQGL